MRLLNPANDATIIGEAVTTSAAAAARRCSSSMRRRYLEHAGADRSGAHRHDGRAHRHLDALQGQSCSTSGRAGARASSSSTSRMSPGTRTAGSRPSARSSRARGSSTSSRKSSCATGPPASKASSSPASGSKLRLTPATKLGIKPTGEKVAGLDVADGGKDRSALDGALRRRGAALQVARRSARRRCWGCGPTRSRRSTAASASCTTTSASAPARPHRCATRRTSRSRVECGGRGGQPLAPVRRATAKTRTCSPTPRRNRGGLLRDRFLETFKASRGEPYDHDAIISLSPAIEELRELKSELSQVTYTYNAAGKVLVNKAPDGSRKPQPGR